MKKRASVKKTIIKPITASHLLAFWGDDTKKEIASYMSAHINNLIDGMTVEDFADIYRGDKEVEAIAEYFHVNIEAVTDNTETTAEEYSINFGYGGNDVPIEWCEADSLTVKDLGADTYREVEVNGKTYFWRWL